MVVVYGVLCPDFPKNKQTNSDLALEKYFIWLLIVWYSLLKFTNNCSAGLASLSQYDTGFELRVQNIQSIKQHWNARGNVYSLCNMMRSIYMWCSQSGQPREGNRNYGVTKNEFNTLCYLQSIPFTDCVHYVTMKVILMSFLSRSTRTMNHRHTRKQPRVKYCVLFTQKILFIYILLLLLIFVSGNNVLYRQYTICLLKRKVTFSAGYCELLVTIRKDIFMNHNIRLCSGYEEMQAQFSWDDQTIRQTFIRKVNIVLAAIVMLWMITMKKSRVMWHDHDTWFPLQVYAILMVQLLVTVAIVALFTFW